jgi:hypothetical protein
MVFKIENWLLMMFLILIDFSGFSEVRTYHESNTRGNDMCFYLSASCWILWTLGSLHKVISVMSSKIE